MGDAYLKEGMRIVLGKLGLEPDTPYSIEQVHANLWISSAFRIKVENTDVSLFVKRLPDDMERRDFFDSWMFFANEAAAYTHVFSEFHKFQKQQGLEKPLELTPKCFYTMLDGNNDVIILEDLSVQGFYMPDRRKGFSMENLTLLMKVLGKFHALSFAMKNQEPKRFQELSSKVKETAWSKDHYEKTSRSLFTTFGKKVHYSLSDMLGPEYLKKLEKISLQNGAALQETSRTDPGNEPWNVVTHGDLWSSNILLSADSSSLRFVDFQQTRYSSPALDVSCVLFLCMDGPMRANHAEDLLCTYHKSLCDFMVELGSSPDFFPYSELKHQLIKYGRYGMGISFLNIPHSMTENDGDLKTDFETSAKDAVVKECSMFGDACLKLLLDNIKDAADMGLCVRLQLGPEYLKKLEKISSQNGNVLQETSRTDPGNEPWNVVTHGDLWSSNILLSADSSSLRFVDFQQTRYSSPALDVSCVLFLCMDGPMRAKHAEDLLCTYHKSLCDFMVELGSSPDFFPCSVLKRQLIKEILRPRNSVAV